MATRQFAAVIPGRPIPAARARVTRKGAYTPEPYASWLSAAIVEIRDAAVRQFGSVPRWTGPCSVTVLFYGARANCDIDNLIKAVLDASQKAEVFVNDKQVMEITAERLSGEPQTTVYIKRLSEVK